MKDCKHCNNGFFDGRFGQDVECVNGVLIDIDEAHEGHADLVRPVAPCHPMWPRQVADPDGDWPNDSIERLAAWADSQPAADDGPQLTPNERAALERCLISERKGGEGWHRESSGYLQVQAILDAGETRTPAEVSLLETALALDERAARITR